MANESVHVFLGRFNDEAEALAYTQAQWEPEPDESASDEEYEEWEESNPRWPLKHDLDAYLDSDFIETITGEDRYCYLGKLLVNRLDLERITAVNPDANTLVLIFKEALGGFEASIRATSKLTYCGEFACDLTRL